MWIRSCFGGPEGATPHIDRLAEEGLRFEQFYVNSPICSPSRCVLLTAQYPQRWGIASYLNTRKENRRRGMADWLDLSAPTLARVLKGRGYATGHFGKWRLGGQRDVGEAPLFFSRPPDRNVFKAYRDENLPDLAVRSGRWKLLCEFDGSRARLHDLESDPADHAAASPEVVERLRGSLLAWHAEMLESENRRQANARAERPATSRSGNQPAES